MLSAGLWKCARSLLRQVARWRQGPLEISDVPQRLFREALDEALPDPVALARARFSYHEQNVIDLFTKGTFTVTKQVYADFKDLDSTFQHPALSVVDIERGY